MAIGDHPTEDFEWDDCLGWKLKRPLVEYIIPPEKPWERQVASIICGHPLIQKMPDEDQAEFEMFIRRVIQTERT